MSIQEMIAEDTLKLLWKEFETAKSAYDNAVIKLDLAIQSLEANQLYETTASIEEKALISEYKEYTI